MCYHLVSRCVRRAWLCGIRNGQSFEHRKRWIEERILSLSESFAVDVLAYAVMSNHFHIVVYYDPQAASSWSDEEVANRWLRAFPSRVSDRETAMANLLCDSERLSRCRDRLGCLSSFMQHLKQPIAVRVNREERVKGHLFEQRFYSAALLDEDAVLTAMRYVDLNPVRARITSVLREAENTSISRRLRDSKALESELDTFVQPLTRSVVGRNSRTQENRPHPGMPFITMRAYVALLEETIELERPERTAPSSEQKAACWRESVRLMRRGQRAYGEAGRLATWLGIRRFRCIEKPAVVLH